MYHSLKVDRLFKLGEYQNIHIEAETSEIPDDYWIDPIMMENIRKDLQLEIFMNYALHREISQNNSETYNNQEWSLMYERFRTDRHQEEYSPILESNTVFENPEELITVDEI